MDFSKVTTPQKVSLLVSFLDIQGYLGVTQRLKDPLDHFSLLGGFAEIVIHEVESAGGRVIKFIGDSALSVFPEEAADEGVRTLISLKARLEAYLSQKGFPNKLRVTAHFGEVAIGLFGEGHCRQLDLFGDAVNTAAVLERAGHGGRLVISPQAFRKLSAATRKVFHRYTPPKVYLAEEG